MSALEAMMTTTAESGLADRALAASAVLAEAGRAPIVVMATLKGGSGKSTAAACLAAHCQRAGLRVAIIDADPQASLLHWASLGEPAMDIDIVADTSETVGARARALAREAELVIIDTAGFRNRTMIDALSVADLAVIPIKASPLDIAAAVETARLIEEINATDERQQRPMAYRLLLTQVTVGSAVARHVRRELAASGYRLFDAELANRVAYAEASLMGRMPVHLDAFSAAARDGEAFAREVRQALGR
jgi:chromosome partitioning protein